MGNAHDAQQWRTKSLGGACSSGLPGDGASGDDRGGSVLRRVSQAEIARELKVAHQTVSGWHDRFEGGREERVDKCRRAVRLPNESAEDLGRVDKELERGPRANGFPTELWTLSHVAEMIEATTGVRCHP